MIFTSKKLHYFMVVSESLCISAASEKLYVTPSPISKSISAIEDELGCLLFLRNSKGIQLTDDGFQLFKELIPVYNTLKEIELKFKSNKNGSFLPAL
ncbi:helix-turn-helix domain-containing protein [Hafnia paralvei]|uniref:helix-turn-helix domain-containing protein n=1 Tax=Hafnia paralvei TaxID=546367 RepID=UPI001033E29B|nr:LysR family transcriptional regulator [Hafnia paralvei]